MDSTTPVEIVDPEPASQRTARTGTSGTGQFVKLPLDVLRRTDLTPADKLVYASIVDRIGENADAYPGVRRIAADCGISRTTAAESASRLESAGLLIVSRVQGNPGGQTNRYRLAERSESGTYQKADVPETGRLTYQKTDAGRTKKRTEPDPLNQTHSTRPKARARDADPWTAALGAMTGTTLQTDGFREAWSEWVEYRRQAGKRLTPATIRAQIRKLEAMGHDRAERSIRNSVAAGWTGLFEPDDRPGGRQRARAVPALPETIKVRDYA